MLHRVLQEIEQADGPITLAELSRRLNIEPGALQGMIDFWVQKGRLQDTAAPAADGGGMHHCGTKSCGGPETCAYIAKMPRTISTTHPANGNSAAATARRRP